MKHRHSSAIDTACRKKYFLEEGLCFPREAASVSDNQKHLSRGNFKKERDGVIVICAFLAIRKPTNNAANKELSLSRCRRKASRGVGASFKSLCDVNISHSNSLSDLLSTDFYYTTSKGPTC